MSQCRHTIKAVDSLSSADTADVTIEPDYTLPMLPPRPLL